VACSGAVKAVLGCVRCPESERCAHSLDQALHGAHVAATANSGTKPPHLMPLLLLPLRRQWWRRRRLVVMVMGVIGVCGAPVASSCNLSAVRPACVGVNIERR
jgi:hypothetical protein